VRSFSVGSIDLSRIEIEAIIGIPAINDISKMFSDKRNKILKFTILEV